MSKDSMQAMISAESAMKQAKVQGSVATKMEGRAGILKAEIKQDAARGGDVERSRRNLQRLSRRHRRQTPHSLQRWHRQIRS